MIKQILAGLTLPILFTFLWWASGTDIPTERSEDMAFFLTLNLICGMGSYLALWKIK